MNTVNPLLLATEHSGVDPDGTGHGAAQVPRRERVRAATEAEILGTARELLLESGVGAVTLREVGRRMGMTASGLYRYVEGHAGLVDRLTASLFVEATQAIRSAVPPVEPGPDGMVRTDDVARCLTEAAGAFRAWSLAHPVEFGLMYAPQGRAQVGCQRAEEAGERFGQVFLDLFVGGLGPDRSAAGETVFTTLPPPMDLLFARAWVRLLGVVMVEVAGQYEYMSVDPDVVFAAEMADCASTIVAALHEVRGTA